MSDVLIANASSEAFLNSFSGYIPHHFMSTVAFNQWFQTEITRLNFIQRTKATSPAGKKKPLGGFNSVGEDDASTTRLGPAGAQTSSQQAASPVNTDLRVMPGNFSPLAVRSISSNSTARLPTSISVHINNPRPRQEAGGLFAVLLMPRIYPNPSPKLPSQDS